MHEDVVQLVATHPPCIPHWQVNTFAAAGFGFKHKVLQTLRAFLIAAPYMMTGCGLCLSVVPDGDSSYMGSHIWQNVSCAVHLALNGWVWVNISYVVALVVVFCSSFGFEQWSMAWSIIFGCNKGCSLRYIVMPMLHWSGALDGCAYESIVCCDPRADEARSKTTDCIVVWCVVFLRPWETEQVSVHFVDCPNLWVCCSLIYADVQVYLRVQFLWFANWWVRLSIWNASWNRGSAWGLLCCAGQ